MVTASSTCSLDLGSSLASSCFFSHVLMLGVEPIRRTSLRPGSGCLQCSLSVWRNSAGLIEKGLVMPPSSNQACDSPHDFFVQLKLGACDVTGTLVNSDNASIEWSSCMPSSTSINRVGMARGWRWYCGHGFDEFLREVSNAGRGVFPFHCHCHPQIREKSLHVYIVK